MDGMGNLAITGALLMLPDGPRRLTLRLDGERIAAIGGSPQPGDRVIDLVGHAVFPGLINSHDQLGLNVFPRIKLRDRYSHAHEWYSDVNSQHVSEALSQFGSVPLSHRLLIGGIKNLLAGTTTVMHHGELHNTLRSRSFPVRVVKHYGWTHSLHSDKDITASFRRTPAEVPWIIRVAEGVNEVAAGELAELDRQGCLRENTVLVHGVGLSEMDIARIIEAGTGLIWCPESNRFLFGEARFHSRLVGRMAIGTASRMTGSLDLLEEIKLAAHLSGLPPQMMLRMVLSDAARLLRLAEAGRLTHNGWADLVVVKMDDRDPFQALLDSHRADLRMVMLGGKPRIADPDLQHVFTITRTAAEPASLDGVPKWIAHDLIQQMRHIDVNEPGLAIA